MLILAVIKFGKWRKTYILSGIKFGRLKHKMEYDI